MGEFKIYLESTFPSIVYHGTTAEKGQLIRTSGTLRPRGQEPGNWASGPFGGNPSRSNVVYCSPSQFGAMSYAKEICLNYGTKTGAIVSVVPDWQHVVIDEDTVHGILSKFKLNSNAIAGKAWLAYANYIQNESGKPCTPQQAYDEYQWLINSDDSSDSGYAEIMKSVAEELTKLLTPNELSQLIAKENVVGFSTSLRVIQVEFINIE
jgi:hypothetical protein